MRGVSCSLAAALLLLRATRAMCPVLRGGRMLVCPSRWWMRSTCVCVCVCPHEPCHLRVASLRPCSLPAHVPPDVPLLNLLPLRSTSSGAKHTQRAFTAEERKLFHSHPEQPLRHLEATHEHKLPVAE